jgi:hypothetical protein
VSLKIVGEEKYGTSKNGTPIYLVECPVCRIQYRTAGWPSNLRSRRCCITCTRIPFAKLTEKDVIEIRLCKDAHRLIAKKYGVSPSTVHKILQGRKWKHVV